MIIRFCRKMFIVAVSLGSPLRVELPGEVLAIVKAADYAKELHQIDDGIAPVEVVGTFCSESVKNFAQLGCGCSIGLEDL